MSTHGVKITRVFSSLAGRILHYRGQLTRTRLYLFTVTLIVFGLALGGLDSHTEDETITGKVMLLSLPNRHDSGLSRIDGSLETTGDNSVASISAEFDQWDRVTVTAGQSLDAIFRQQGFSAASLQQVMALNKETSQLRKIRPGDQFAFQRYTDGSLRRMRYALDETHYLLIEHNGRQAYASIETREIFTEARETSGTITSSLFLAGKQAGLSDNMVMKLANLFGWDIDFVLDIRAGDRFFLIYEKIYRDGNFLRDGEIIGATFINRDEKFQAVRFHTGDMTQYFAPNGHTMHKSFLRAPLSFSYISSNFNPKRFHPILKRVKAHKGIDYRAPRGTPVLAAGEGRVIRSAYSKNNGHHVIIQHANNVVTKYLHFTNRKVKQGQRVEQGEVIGYVGSTGLAEAPHLHYEFILNGVHRNPRTVDLPAAEPLDGTRLSDFHQAAAPVLTRLSHLEAASMYASP